MSCCWKLFMTFLFCLPLSIGCSAKMSQSAAEQALQEQEAEETPGEEDDSGQGAKDYGDTGESGDEADG